MVKSRWTHRLLVLFTAFFTWLGDTIQDRRMETHHGWRFDLGKDLDIWQKSSDNPFGFGRSRREFYLVDAAFSIRYVKIPVVGAADRNGCDGV